VPFILINPSMTADSSFIEFPISLISKPKDFVLKSYHTYVAKIDSRTLKSPIAVHIMFSEIGAVPTKDSYEFWYWKNEFLSTVLYGATYFVKGCISRVTYDATKGTYVRRLSTWHDAISQVIWRLSNIHSSFCKMVRATPMRLPVVAVEDARFLKAITFKLVYTREDALDGSVPFALDENFDVCNISKNFIGFLLMLRTSPSPSGSSKIICASPSASGSPKITASPSASGSPMKGVASAFGFSSELVDSPSKSVNPLKRAVSPSAIESPFKRISSSVAGNSPTQRIGGTPATHSSVKPSEEKECCIYGLVNIFHNPQNPIVLPLYSLDEGLVSYLMGRFGCGKIRGLQYVMASEAREFCKKHHITDTFQ